LNEYLDNETGICYTYKYDSLGNVIEVEQYKGTDFVGIDRYEHNYDYKNRLEATTYGATGHRYKPIYEKVLKNRIEYDSPDDSVVGVVLETKQGNEYSVKYKVDTIKDDLGRPEYNRLTLEDDIDPLLLQTYTYLKNEDPDANGKYITTDFVETVEDQAYGVLEKTTVYTYDANGNIETVTENGTLVSKYYYDKWNRLVREDNHKLAKTYTWSYDIGGNILEKRIYTLCTDELDSYYESKVYAYETTGNRDRMACYNNECCAYDSLGNPYMYRCHDLSWTKVRKLASFDNIQFKYNASGIRYQKFNEITEKTTNYTLDGDRILKETDGTNTITYYYANGNAPIGFNYNGTDYYFCKNIQGDVVGIYNASGHIVVKYVYDAWGNHKIYDANNNEVTSTSHIGYINPIRYRGYYFDVETGLYYLGARYYDPDVGRFINADSTDVVTTTLTDFTDKNLYAYCDNNPITRKDDGGEFWNFVIGGVVGAVVGGVTAAISSYKSSGEVNLWSTLVGATTGAIGGVIGASGICALGQAVASGVLNAATNVATSYIEEKDISVFDVALDAAIGAIGSSVGSFATRKLASAAEDIISRGAKRVISGITRRNSGSRYWKGAVKRGAEIMRKGIHDLDVARGKASVIGTSVSGGLAFLKLFCFSERNEI
jgi:RHS repeat-associated protein